MPIFPPAVKLVFGWNRFGKRTIAQFTIRIYFQKKSCDPIDKIINRLHLSKCIPVRIQNSSHVKKIVNNA